MGHGGNRCWAVTGNEVLDERVWHLSGSPVKEGEGRGEDEKLGSLPQLKQTGWGRSIFKIKEDSRKGRNQRAAVEATKGALRYVKKA